MWSAIVVLAAFVALTGAPPPDHASGKLDHVLALPDENDSFETIRKNKLYVDKTPALAKLLESNSNLFYLTRPRKFGKTVFLRMLYKFFLGESALFQKLAIFERGNTIGNYAHQGRYAQKKEQKWTKYPVVILDFGRTDFRTASVKDFRRLMLEELAHVARSLKQSPNKVDISVLIDSLHRVFDLPVVVLVDAFDAPILDAYNSNDVERAKGILSLLQEMFTMIEEQRAKSNVGLVFVTGVSRFKVFLEDGGAKDFVDLTEDKDFATAFGFTVKEIESLNFEPHLKRFARNRNTTREEIMKELTQWYEGYKFSSKEKTKVLNPVSVNKCLQKQKFDSYWCALGPTKDVLDIFVKEKMTIDDLENFRIDRECLFKTHDIDDGLPPYYSLLLHEGYLMIKNYDRNDDMCVLDYPNKEIKQYLKEQLSGYVGSQKKFISELPEWGKQLQEAMRDQKIPSMMEVLKRYGFPILTTDRSQSGVWDWGVTRRLRLIFDAASIKYPEAVEEGAELPATKTIHLKTLQLPINYVFEIECEKGAREAILRLIKFAQDESDAFKKSIDQQKEVYLVGLSFTESGQGEFDDWICLPYKEGGLKFGEVQAETQDSVDYVKKLRKT